MFFSFAKRLWQPKSLRRSSHRPRVTRLSLEHLEDRLVPSATSFEPWQIQQAYGFNQISFNGGAVKGNGTGQTIAIVDAYNDPNIAKDVNKFDQLYGLTSTNSPTLYAQYGAASKFLTVVNQTGGSTLPANNSGWGMEISLDVEWAHAIAPGAKILLVEANSSSGSDLYAAANYAGTVAGVSAVSMSFGASFPGESGADSDFSHSGVTYVAAAGDNGLFIYPAASANVVGVGGTSLTLNSAGKYVSEKVWNDSSHGGSEPVWLYESSAGEDVLQNPPPKSYGESGGGPSPYDSTKPGPDVAYNADPYTGYNVYDSYGEPGLLKGVGGTSDGSPQWAALFAIADQGRALAGQGSLSSSQALAMIHNSNMELFDFHDGMSGSIKYELNGTQYSYSGSQVYGQGTPIANVLVQDLVYGAAPLTPSLTAATGSSSVINLSWNSVTDAHSYTLQWSTDDVTWNPLATTSATSYSATGLQAGTTYFFRIEASNGLGSSAFSTAASATTVPTAPTGLTATAVSSSEIDLSWNAVLGASDGYVLVRSLTGVAGSFTAIGSTAAGVTTFQDIDVDPNTTYYYEVEAVDAGGDSAFSNIASATTT